MLRRLIDKKRRRSLLPTRAVERLPLIGTLLIVRTHSPVEGGITRHQAFPPKRRELVAVQLCRPCETRVMKGSIIANDRLMVLQNRLHVPPRCPKGGSRLQPMIHQS